MNKLAVQPLDSASLKTLGPSSHPIDQIRQLKSKYSGDWLWRTIAAKIPKEGIETGPTELSHELKAPLSETVEALEGLEALGVIERIPRGYRQVNSVVYLTDRELKHEKLMADHVLISSQILSRLSPFQSARSTFYRTGFLSSSKELMQDFCEKVEALMVELLEKSDASTNNDEVYAFSFSALNLTERKDSEENRS